MNTAETVNDLIVTAKQVERAQRVKGVRGFMQANGCPAVRITKKLYDELFPGIEPEKSWKTFGVTMCGVWFWFGADEK